MVESKRFSLAPNFAFWVTNTSSDCFAAKMAMLAPAAEVTLTLLSEVAVRLTALDDAPTPRAAPVAEPSNATEVVVKSLFRMILPFWPAATANEVAARAFEIKLPPDT